MGLRLFLRSFLLKRGIALSHPPGQLNVVDWKLEQLRDHPLRSDGRWDASSAVLA